ncbi:MAG TPA: hypothetical protein VHZ54_17135 [Solirubrobacterales bacterium]|nr:hypothetical protein [Solirubrobacterales bacterium]
MTAVGAAVDQVNVFKATTPILGFDPDDGPDALALFETRNEAKAKAHRLVWELAREGQRLNLRFDRSDDVPTCFRELRDLIIEFISLIDVEERFWTAEQAEATDTKLDECGAKNRQLVLAARAAVEAN